MGASTFRRRELARRCRKGANRPPPRASRPLACQKSRAAHLHARHTRAMHACIPSPPPTATPAAPDAPRTRISLLPAALLNASRNHPPALMPRAAPPWRQTMNLESIMAYVSRFDGWCGATRGGFSFSRSFLRSQMCRVGRRRHRPWGRRAARSADFLLFVRERVLCESNNMIELHNPLCTRTHGTHVPRRVISHRCTHTP